jgi:tetratricopeptide (TPR) repeat protein
MATINEKQQNFAGKLVEQVLRFPTGRDALWNLTGSVGSGKTSVLHLIQESFWATGTIPLMVTAPAGEVDAGPIALLEAADQLEAAHLLNGERGAINDPKLRWSDKMAAITAAIERNHNSVVILCDEPALWHRTPQASLEDTPEHCARSFADWIARESTCRRIVSGWVDVDVPVRGRPPVPRLDDGRSFLAESGYWFSAESIAGSLNNALTQELPERSPWEMKLCVALARFKEPRKVAEQVVNGTSVLALLEEVFDLVEGEEYRVLREGLALLAIPRTYMREQVFNDLTRELTSLDRDLIRSCLCVQESDRIALHPLLRREMVNRARDPQRAEKNQLWRLRIAERRGTHQRLHQEYPSAKATSFRDQLEGLHHELLGGTGLPNPSDNRLRFVEQLHELGRTLSYVFREHQRAANLFRLALEFDPDHPYSHHYLAFNLDWLAQETQEVEAHYQKAIELQPTHPWWWSRWVSYLATRGRFRQARSVWRSALDAMSVSEDGSPEWVYLSLHRWVARWLLHWAELDFAEDVLRSIPSTLSERDASIQALWNLLGALRIAELGPAVFPLTVPITEWWSANGHTGLPLTHPDHPKQEMRFWRPARVSSVDQHSGRLFLVVADRPAEQKAPLHYRDVDLSRDQVEHDAHGFTWADLEEGRFLELAYYGAEETLLIGLHRVTEYRDPQLIPLVPPPDRWYRQAVDAAWDSTEEVA